MTNDFKTSVLGDTGLKVGRLGLAASYGAPTQAFEEAFEKGCNYFYLGSGRHRSDMKKAVRNLCSQGQRDKMVISIQTYARFGFMTEFLFKQSLKASDCYRFALSNPSVDVCLCGPKNLNQMRTALTSLDSGPLETKDMEKIILIGDHVHKHAKSFFS